MTLTTVKLRIYPNSEQENQILLTLGHTRYLWNTLLDMQNTRYENNNKAKYLSGYDMAILIPMIKQENPWLKEADAIAMQEVTTALDKAFKGFFKKIMGYPRFKCRKSTKQSYTTKQRIRIVDKTHIKLPKLGPVKFMQKSIPEGKIKTATVSRISTGKYYASVVIEREVQPLPKTGKKVGIDCG